MADLAAAAAEFAELAKNLRLVGETELRAELFKAINDTAEPLKNQISDTAHLEDCLPNGYVAAFAADLRVTVSKRTSGTGAGVTVAASAPTLARGGRGRKVRRLDAGLISHPLYGDREHWYTQTSGMRPGWFSGPADRAAPRLREEILAAVRRAEDKALGR